MGRQAKLYNLLCWSNKIVEISSISRHSPFSIKLRKLIKIFCHFIICFCIFFLWFSICIYGFHFRWLKIKGIYGYLDNAIFWPSKIKLERDRTKPESANHGSWNPPDLTWIESSDAKHFLILIIDRDDLSILDINDLLIFLFIYLFFTN